MRKFKMTQLLSHFFLKERLIIKIILILKYYLNLIVIISYFFILFYITFIFLCNLNHYVRIKNFI